MPVHWLRIAFLAAGIAVAAGAARAGQTYHVDAACGDDGNSGLAPGHAWRSLERANRATFAGGDRLLLARGGRFAGTLAISVAATADAPFVVGAYGEGGAERRPAIDAAGFECGVRLRNCRHVVVEDLAIVADAGPVREPAARLARHGVLIATDAAGDHGPVTVRRLHIRNVFATEERADEGSRATSNQGMGVTVQTGAGRLAGVRIEECVIQRTGRTGINLTGGRTAPIENVEILNNRLEDIGGPGMNPKRCRQVVVRGNIVDRSGSSVDPRMHARGSGIWPWGSEDVLIEHNRFLHARGKADSCGAHIDFGCRDVIVQYNLSVDNEGGFIEILGDNEHCAYRYNVSVNDGFRVKGRNGAAQEGKVLWTSGYTGRGQARSGPLNSYIYNNTVYVKPGSRSCFSIAPTTRGLLVANNVFHVEGETLHVAGDQDARREAAVAPVPGAVVTNNVYVTARTLPAGVPFADARPIYGDVEFARPGGTAVEDCLPRNRALVLDRGVAIERLPGDTKGLKGGLAVTRDILGRPIAGRPDVGAIELPGQP